MYKKYAVLLAVALALGDVAGAAPIMRFAPDSVSRAIDTVRQPDESGSILVQTRARGGGGGQWAAGGGQRAGGASSRGNFNANNFNRDVSNTGNRNVNRNTNVNASRNVNVSGGCCDGDYDEGPTWGGVAAGVAVGAVVGAAASSAAQTSTYAAPPPTYPYGYVTPPPY